MWRKRQTAVLTVLVVSLMAVAVSCNDDDNPAPPSYSPLTGDWNVSTTITEDECFDGYVDPYREGEGAIEVEEDATKIVSFTEETDFFFPCDGVTIGARSGNKVTGTHNVDFGDGYTGEFKWDITVGSDVNSFTGTVDLTVAFEGTSFCTYQETYAGARCSDCFDTCESSPVVSGSPILRKFVKSIGPPALGR